MDRKLLFFDIDGTLLAGGIPGYIPDSAIHALKTLQANGHYIFINSGRTYSFMPKPIREFPFDGYICGCGTEIILHGETIFHYEIPKELRVRMKDVLKEANVQGVFEGHSACYYNFEEEFLPPLAHIYESYTKIELPNAVRGFDDPEFAYDKFVIITHEGSDLEKFRSLTENDFQLMGSPEQRPYGFGEVVPKACSKATGIDFLVDYLGLSLEDCYVFGDGPNDLSMLRHVKNSVAMGNSFPEILGKTSYVTTPVDRDGIYVALKHFGLI